VSRVDIPEVHGFELITIVAGVVQFIKEQFGLEGKSAQQAALGVGVVVFGYWSAMQAGVIPEGVGLWANIVIRTVGYALAAPGLFKLVKHELLPAVAC